jgi:hypothetical protein
MPVIVGAKFENSTEVLDGKEYRGCEFRGCTLVYNGGPLPALIENHFIDCGWQFGEAAERTIRLLAGLYTQPGSRQLIENTFSLIRGQAPAAPPGA